MRNTSAFQPNPSKQVEFVNSTSAGTGDSTSYTTLNLPALNCATGNLIVVGVRATIPTSITDTAGNTYVKIIDGTASLIGDVSLWYAKNITGNASNVIAVNFSASSQFIEAIASQYAGVDPVNPLDASGFKTITSNATSVTSDSFSTNFDSSVIVGFATQNGTGIAFTPGSGYTERLDGSSAALQDQIVSSIQSSVTMSMSSGLSARWGLVFASFKSIIPNNGTTKAYYPLNGNSRDFSGNGNTGTDTAITYPQGRFGQGARFNGSSSQILFTTVPQTGAGSFTASVWVKGSTLVNNMEILFWGNVATHQGFDVYMNTSGVMSANFYGGGGQANATTKLTTHSWQHVVATYDGNNTRIYINGRLEGVSSAYTSANIGTTNKFIGKDAGGGNWWNGLADEIILESRAWTAKEIETYYRKSMLNYKQSLWAKLLASFSISETLALSETTSALRTRNFTLSESLSLSETVTALKGIAFSVADTLGLVEATSFVRTRLFNVAESLGLVEVLAQVKKKWLNATKSVSSWTQESKNTSTFTSQSKNSSIWTKKIK